MATFNVDVSVVRPIGEEDVLYININPETVPLDGSRENIIVWKMSTPGTAVFLNKDDVKFTTTGGRNQFNVTFDNETKEITATINREEENRTVYTYYLTVHLLVPQAAIRIDPEVDNPPPPPVP